MSRMMPQPTTQQSSTSNGAAAGADSSYDELAAEYEAQQAAQESQQRENQPIITDYDSDAELHEDESRQPIVEEVSEDEVPIVTDTQQQPSSSTNEAPSAGQVMMYDRQAAEERQRIAAQIQQTARGQRRSDDHSASAYGDTFASRYGHPDTLPTPSAPTLEALYDDEQPPSYEEVIQAMSQYALATPSQRKSHAKHQQFKQFFENGGLENRRTTSPYVSAQDIPLDDHSQQFKDKMKQAAELLSANPAAEDVDPEMRILLGQSKRAKDFAHDMPVYLPPKLLESCGENRDRALEILLANPYYDEIHGLVAETSAAEQSSWMFGEKVASGTLQVRMTAEGSKSMVLGEGYKTRVGLGGSDQWRTVAEKISKNTDFFHVKDNFTIIRIKPGEVGLVQQMNGAKQFLQLKPGRYFLNERLLRLVGISKLVPNQQMTFTPKTADAEIRELAQRFSLISLQKGKRLFAEDRQGVFFLDANDANDSPYIFDSAALEKPLNVVNIRDIHQRAIDHQREEFCGYHIIRLRQGERVLVRGQDGNDKVIEFDPENPQLNTLYLPSTHYDVHDKVYNRDDKIVVGDNITSIKLSNNDVLVVRDTDGTIRFLDQFDPRTTMALRAPWKAIEVISKMTPIYTYEDHDLKVTRIKPSANQWPVIYDQELGEIKLLPPALEYVISTAEGQSFVGLADANKKEAQQFEVPGAGQLTSVVVPSGQVGMVRIKNFSFFLPPSPAPYIIRSPDEYFGLIDNKQTHVQIPESDLHRIYIAPGQWAVAVVDGRQVILDPEKLSNDSPEAQGNGIWIFRAQQLELQGPVSINEKQTQLFNVQRIQVSMDEVAYGYGQGGSLKIWGPGNHTIINGNETRFEGFFQTKLDDVSITEFDVVWKGGIKGKIDVSVAFHIDGILDTTLGHNNYDKVKGSIALCGHHETLRAKVMENTKHALLDVIAQMEPLGYGYDRNRSANNLSSASEMEKQADTQRSKTLGDLERLFSDEVRSILAKYNVVVDNVTITKNMPDPTFVQESERLLKEVMTAHKDAQVAELEKQKQSTEQAQRLQEEKAQSEIAAEKAKQQQIDADAKAAQVATEARARAEAAANEAEVKKANELKQQEMEAASKVRQQELKIKELEQKQAATEQEMKTRQLVAEKEAETKAIEATAEALANAKAKAQVAELELRAMEFHVKTQELQARGNQAMGLAEMIVKEKGQYGSLSPDQILQLRLAESQGKTSAEMATALLKAGVAAPGLTQLALSPQLLARIGAADGISSLLQGGQGAASLVFSPAANSAALFGTAAGHAGVVNTAPTAGINPSAAGGNNSTPAVSTHLST